MGKVGAVEARVCGFGRGVRITKITTLPPFSSSMSAPPPRRSSRRAESDSGDHRNAPSPISPSPKSQTNAGRPPASQNRVRKCVRGEWYKVPGDQFDPDSDDDEPHPAWFYGVVIEVQKTGCKMLFSEDEIATRYDGFLETWVQYRVIADELDDKDNDIFQKIEIAAKLRKPPRALVRRRDIFSSSEDDSAEEDGETRQGAAVVVETWESDAEDDECEDQPDVDDDDDANDTLQAQFVRSRWETIPRLHTDPRARENAMPENITPAFLLPSYRDETLLNWFLFYMPVTLIVEITQATNEKAKEIEWPQESPWRHLRVGEFLRWLGLWVMMTVYPIAGGGRRTYWRGMLKFGRWMSEKRFENILRTFALPQYKREDPEWGGPARTFYSSIKFDKFQETRKFTDMMRKRFQAAMKPGGWLCIDESMFSWLGRALKLPGWKVIKRKPHPIGLEAKTVACAAVGAIVDFEFQEGHEPMGHFEYVKETNRSTAWLLRLTKAWHNTEQRTVIADAAFAQVRAAVALKRIGGLFFIGNVKGCTKYFCKAELKTECGNYERDKLVVTTKKLDLGEGPEKTTIFGTGWRCTGDMVITYVHTGGTNALGSDRTKRKHIQMSDGKVFHQTYNVKRPKVSSEYQSRMGAIDSHNYRRQSGKSTASLEKVCITRNTKDRVFINIMSWILINIYLIQKHFVWLGEEKKGPSELQELVAMSLINNQYYSESSGDCESDLDEDDELLLNDPEDCKTHPQYKKNLCKFCYLHKTVYYCAKCSRPKDGKMRKEKGPKGGSKYTHSGYMHFCKHKGCFARHKCGEAPRRRSKAQMMSSASELHL